MDAADNDPPTTLAGGFRIGDLRVDPSTGEVSGPGGSVQLDPKVMGVLVMLAERAGEVVSRDVLLARLWPDVVVTDDALSRCLYELRRQLVAAGGGEEFRALVETLHKRGYRLNGEVTAAPVQEPAARARSRTGLVIGLLVAAAAIAGLAVILARTGPSELPRVAILPFLDMTEGQDQAWLGDGIAEEITDRLSRSEDLKVIARTSAFSFRGQAAAVPEIARTLDVSHVLEGSVRRSGKRIRVTAQLIASSDGAHLWSETYERDLHDIFAIQDEIAVAVATELEATIKGIDERHSTKNVDALVQFAQGEHFYHRREPGDIERAIEAYKKAVALDPRYARAWASLAGAYNLLANESDPPDAALRAKQGEAARRAVELDPKLGVAQYRLGQFYAKSGDLRTADVHFSESFRLDPGSLLTLHVFADDAFDRGDVEAAVGHLQQAVAADPMALTSRKNLAVMLMAAGRYEAALTELRSVRENYSGPNPNLDSDIVRALVLLGRFAEAAAVVDAMAEGRPKEHGTAILAGMPARRADSDAALARLASRPPAGLSMEDAVMDSMRLAEAYAVRGRTDEAMQILLNQKREIERRPDFSPRYAWSLSRELRGSPMLKPLHSHLRWDELTTSPQHD